MISALAARGEVVGGGMETTGMTEEASHPLFCFVSKDGRWAAGTTWDTCGRLFHNNDPWIGCIHAGPTAREVGPGAKERFTGWLFFSDDGLQGCIDVCERTLAAGGRGGSGTLRGPSKGRSSPA